MFRSVLVALALASALFTSPSIAGVAATFQEDFAANPASRGWNARGDASLFSWNAAQQQLDVTWDSSRPNSFLHRPLGTVLTRADDFTLAFDLRLTDIAVGTTGGKPFTFEIALGLVRWREAAAAGFLRGTGFSSPNLVEFDYFPDSGFGATVSPTIISSNHVFASGFNSPFELTPGADYHVEMRFSAAEQHLVTTMTRNGEAFGPIKDVPLGPDFTDFRVDHVAIASYSDAGQDPQFSGSVLAHGMVDNLVITTPEPLQTLAALAFDGATAHVSVAGQAGWRYTLERTTDFATWTPVGEPLDGAGVALALADPNPPAAAACYRVSADKP